MQQRQDKTSNNGGKAQNGQIIQAIVVENTTINQIRRGDNKQEIRRKKERKSVSKVNIRYDRRN
eukprot:196992-Ditylum_brightwellii.AAC.1